MKRWTKEEEQLLLDNYPYIDKDQLLKMFPNRSMKSLYAKYCRMNTYGNSRSLLASKNRRKTIDYAKDVLRPLNLDIDENSYISFTRKSTIICSCGRRFKAMMYNIQSGDISSCGHCNDPSMGDKYGKLTIIKVINGKKRGCKVVCKCDCGNITKQCNFYRIKIGLKRSCGYCNLPNIGDRYGKLTIIDIHTNNLTRKWTVTTQCDCGNEYTPSRWGMVSSGNTKSCGNCKLYCNGVATSHKAKELHNIVEEIVDHPCYHNYTIDGKCFDTVDLDNRITVEYDEHHWHRKLQDTTKKEKADTRLAIKHGFKMLRVRAHKDLPTKEQLEKAINNHFEHGAKQHTITTPGWKNASIK